LCCVVLCCVVLCCVVLCCVVLCCVVLCCVTYCYEFLNFRFKFRNYKFTIFVILCFCNAAARNARDIYLTFSTLSQIISSIWNKYKFPQNFGVDRVNIYI
jgi:ABC-type maltose transport system permease subunit